MLAAPAGAAQLYAFGANGQGQLGPEATVSSTGANPTPVPVALPGAIGPVVQAAAGGGHNLVPKVTAQVSRSAQIHLPA